MGAFVGGSEVFAVVLPISFGVGGEVVPVLGLVLPIDIMVAIQRSEIVKTLRSTGEQ